MNRVDDYQYLSTKSNSQAASWCPRAATSEDRQAWASCCSMALSRSNSLHARSASADASREASQQKRAGGGRGGELAAYLLNLEAFCLVPTHSVPLDSFG